jgi:hypothetical protein
MDVKGETAMTMPPTAAHDDDFARVTGATTTRLTAGLLAFLTADIASAIVTLFWL